MVSASTENSINTLIKRCAYVTRSNKQKLDSKKTQKYRSTKDRIYIMEKILKMHSLPLKATNENEKESLIQKSSMKKGVITQDSLISLVTMKTYSLPRAAIFIISIFRGSKHREPLYCFTSKIEFNPAHCFSAKKQIGRGILKIGNGFVSSLFRQVDKATLSQTFLPRTSSDIIWNCYTTWSTFGIRLFDAVFHERALNKCE